MDKKLLKYGRHLSGLTQTELGRLVGLDGSTIAHYETGKNRMIDRTQRGILEVFASHGMGYDEMKTLENIIEKQDQLGG